MREYAAVRELIDEVDNGGLSQYFFNSSGDDCAYALEGLSKMELESVATILKQACAQFRPESPSPNRHRRQQQLQGISKTTETVFSKLDDDFYKFGEELETKSLLFVAKKAAEFKATAVEQTK